MFVGIEFNVLKNISSFYKVLGLSFILVGIFLMFIFALIDMTLYVLNDDGNFFTLRKMIYPLILVAFIFVGAILCSYGNEESYIENHIYQRMCEKCDKRFEETNLKNF